MVSIFTRRRILLFFGGLLAIGILNLSVWSIISGPDVVYRNLRYCCDSEIDDFKHYPGRSLRASASPFHFGETDDEAGLPEIVTIGGNEEVSLDDFLRSSDTIAFLIIKDDTILYERYFQGHSQSAISQAFSASKSILSILIGTAVDDGYIESVDQAVTDFVPELANSGFDSVTLKDLLQMKSSMDYTEDDNPFGEHTRFNYTANLEAQILKLEADEEPSEAFSYKSGGNALLALILERALKTKTITQYTQERLWTPLGMEYDGIWSLDHSEDGLEKTWCCLAAAARDFAKFGRLFLMNGNWNGDQILSHNWVVQSTAGAFNPSTWPSGQAEMGIENYGYQWWLASEARGDYFARGKNGQLIYVNPDERVIIVRLGWSSGDIGYGELSSGNWLALFTFLAEEVR